MSAISIPPIDTALLDRLSRVLHELSLPCACQEEVERTVAVFAAFEDRRARRRLLDQARERARRLIDYVDYLHDLDEAELDAADIAALADTFRVISAAASEGAASLETLTALDDDGREG